MILVEIRYDQNDGWGQVGSTYATLSAARLSIPMVKDTYKNFEIRIVLVVEEIEV